MNGILLTRVRGIDVKVNWSVLVIGVLIAWSLADVVLPDMVEGESTTAYWTAGVVCATAYLASLVAHEFGHATVAARHGVEVTTINLWLFGGMAILASQPTNPRAAWRIATAGPLVSFAIGVVALTLSGLFDGLLGASMLWFSVMNVILAVFNMLPAFPMDGGRVYQAVLWRRSGDERRSTRRAARMGRTVGGALVLLGILQVLLGAIAAGMWLVFVGWFVREAAEAEWHRDAMEQSLGTLTVRHVMTADPVVVSEDVGVDEFLAGAFFSGRHATYPVTGSDGSVVGVIALADVRRVDHADRVGRTVGELAQPLSKLIVSGPDTDLNQITRELRGHRGRRALVMDDGELVGIVSPSDVDRLLSIVDMTVPEITD